MTTTPTASHPSPARRVLGLVAGNWISRCYLLLVLALLAWVTVDAVLIHQEDASLAAAVPMLVTLPFGFAAVLLPDGSALGYYLVVAAAALINAALLGLITGRRRRGW